MQIRVYYEDTDLGGIVYHANYLKFCERARSELFFEKGLIPLDGNRSFVVTKIEANFLGSANLADMLSVTTKVLQTKRLSITLLQEVYKDETKIFSAIIKLAYLDNGKPIIIPQNQLDILKGDN
ncbi:MAG: YbgC/FadM family acyl-CoA thioesterase [Arcobacteraceae bacterium]|nr:YbgC/FadM family acyl-CoA thioesterase [Arcobacteraceae bacterium]